MVGTTTKKLKIQAQEFPFSIKQLNEDLGTFEGYASTWSVDLQKDKIMRGAFANTIAEAKARMERRNGQFLFALLFMHDPKEPIGGIYSAEETQHGLFIRGLIDLETQQGRRAFSGMKKGYCNSFSIGYRVVKDRMGAPNLRVLEQIDLIEVSVVSFPANPEAQVTSVKTANDAWMESLLRDMERTARKYGAKKVRNGMSDFDDAAFGAAPMKPYSIEPGLDPQEDTKNFQREIRAQLRAEDPDLYSLTPGGKAYNAEIARRQAARDERRRLEREALMADRKAIADRQIDPLEEYTIEQLAAKSGIEIGWLIRLVQACVAGGEVTPAVEGTLVLKGCDFMKLAKRHHEEFETQYVSAGRKRAERLARERAAA